MGKSKERHSETKAKSPGSMKDMIMQMQKKSLVQSNPKLAALILIVTYFVLDFAMMDVKAEPSTGLRAVLVMLAPSLLYSYYVNDYHKGLYPKGGTDVPAFARNKRKFVIVGWAVITAWGIISFIAEPYMMPKLFPVLAERYYNSQLMLMLFVAPVIEEVIFRYLLYDRWLRPKWGWLGGFLASSFLFVICHPVTNVHAMVIYWVPTVLFFLVYHEFGLYGAILIHMVYNMMAI